MPITFNQLEAQGKATRLEINQWTLETGQSWGIFSAAGDIGALLGDLLCAEITPEQGSIEITGQSVAQVSLTEQQRLLDVELAKDDTDFLDRIDHGTSVYTLVFECCHNARLTEQLLDDLDLTQLKSSGFRMLSTGETRRVMLARALAQQPDLLVLDNPFSGLDIQHRQSLADFLERLATTTPMLITFSREEDMPEWIEHIALFDHGRLDATMNQTQWQQHPVIAQIKAQSQQQSQQMIALIRRHQHSSSLNNPIFELSNGEVAYLEKTIFSGLNWRIEKDQHWQVKGPNGCGKSTLLGLIFGDHPQCYSNDIKIFGRQRGSGESIWEIKQNIGMVSSAIHLQYRVNCRALEVILSGFYDSIGLYQQPSRKEIDLAREWLEILHMSQYANTPFKQLEYGQQRLLLIARAIVKQPALLILDEPYQGLDYLGRRLVKNTLELIARENLSQLLYVSHYQEDSLDSIHHYLQFVYDEAAQCYRGVIDEF
ncbi:molybdate ABC transporter ATP-binding protein ModF [Vibrio sp. CAU 1672]|uniref:molybdate ABC transporter ATP-binding protein ModF n=1 Tax=Vibrio sp. CAU 1672 TaxID=3032594 RepID=UPI0023DB9D80|nr:molybdate ABC transporter ATP-binding protein ModF [Vibrio sp. CAU 1672]MDF2153471.1 molybdate ABC transporter ATP-binding protein ModF [Vibrio sp. CAU 1672]